MFCVCSRLKGHEAGRLGAGFLQESRSSTVMRKMRSPESPWLGTSAGHFSVWTNSCHLRVHFNQSNHVNYLQNPAPKMMDFIRTWSMTFFYTDLFTCFHPTNWTQTGHWCEGRCPWRIHCQRSSWSLGVLGPVWWRVISTKSFFVEAFEYLNEWFVDLDLNDLIYLMLNRFWIFWMILTNLGPFRETKAIWKSRHFRV